MEKIDTNPHKYVVFDVETNGLNPKKDDLLSFSLYKPDDKKAYTRFLPLELANTVKTTSINGIKTSDLKECTPLTKQEFNEIVSEFELKSRIILTYSGDEFDEKFLKEYMRRHSIYGFNDLKFQSIKRQFLSSIYSGGNVSKDNLCIAFGIEGVSDIHSSENDCLLEWRLFEKMDGDYFLITHGNTHDYVYRMNSEYVIPASYLVSYPNLNRLIRNRPYIKCESKLVKVFEFEIADIQRYGSNFEGLAIEQLINKMLNVKTIDSTQFLSENKNKLEYIGKIPGAKEVIPLQFREDGSVKVLNEKYAVREKSMNSSIDEYRQILRPMVEYIRDVVFEGAEIFSQELVVNNEHNILALCDLSSKEAVLEIKTDNNDAMYYKEQFYYEANGRKCYHLQMEWVRNTKTLDAEKIVFKISEIECEEDGEIGEFRGIGIRARQRKQRVTDLKEKLKTSNIILLDYYDTKHPVRLKCMECGYEWEISYYLANKTKPQCQKCRLK